jgi:hypothetical protein
VTVLGGLPNENGSDNHAVKNHFVALCNLHPVVKVEQVDTTFEDLVMFTAKNLVQCSYPEWDVASLVLTCKVLESLTLSVVWTRKTMLTHVPVDSSCSGESDCTFLLMDDDATK